MAEIWCGDEKVGEWPGAGLPTSGDEIGVELDGEDYNARVTKVFKRYDKAGAMTQIVEIDDPRPMSFIL